MATPLGHVLAGLAVARLGAGGRGPSDRALLAACCALALLPDLDFLPGLLAGTPALYHQGVTHSLALGLAASLVAALWVRSRGRGFAAAWGISFAAFASHLGLDLLGPDARAPYGIPLLWPLSDATFLSPVALLPGMSHAATTGAPIGEWLAGVLSPHNASALAMELGVLLPVLLLTELALLRSARRAKRSRALERSAAP